MDKLWAPWRVKYLRTKKTKKCIFCEGIKSAVKNYVILKTRYSIAMLNIFPYNNGHMMISPRRHVRELSLLRDNEALDLLKTLNNAKGLLDESLHPDGYNIGINVSEAAGAGIKGHLHIHIVPRWKGDTNFMPALYDTKVISQSLDELCRRLKRSLKNIAGDL